MTLPSPFCAIAVVAGETIRRLLDRKRSHTAMPRASVSHAGGVTEEWTADPNGMARPRAIAAKKDGAALWSTGDYLYDGAGNIVRIGSTDYRYDPFGRLISWTQNGAGGGYSSTGRGYDTFGNYLYSSISGCGSLPPAGQTRPCFSTSVHGRQITSAFYQGLQQSTNRYTGITCDAAGNVTNDGRSFSYDPAGMTTKAVINGRDYRYLYSADDERIGFGSVTFDRQCTSEKDAYRCQ
jgi:YD repeat-containing protein